VRVATTYTQKGWLQNENDSMMVAYNSNMSDKLTAIQACQAKAFIGKEKAHRTSLYILQGFSSALR
jgi:hypothetical protein